MLPNEKEAAAENVPTLPIDTETKHSDDAALEPTRLIEIGSERTHSVRGFTDVVVRNV